MDPHDHVESVLMRMVRGLLAMLLVGVAAAGPAAAQERYPSRPIEAVVVFPPGGPLDTAFRIIQPRLSAILGAPVAVVTKGGAGGALGMDFVAKAKPDGYTIVASVKSTLTIIPAMRSDLSYRLSDFAVVGSYAIDSQVVVAKAGGPIRTFESMITEARRQPGALSYASAGVGSISHLNMELVKAARGLDITHVPFAGTGPVKNAILGGHVPLASSAISPLLPLIRSGDLVALVTTSPKRLPGLDTVPTLVEKGLAEAALSTTMQLYAPARTPREVVDRLAQALEQTMQDAAVVGALERVGLLADYRDPETTRRDIEREHETVARVVKKLGLGK